LPLPSPPTMWKTPRQTPKYHVPFSSKIPLIYVEKQKVRTFYLLTHHVSRFTLCITHQPTQPSARWLYQKEVQTPTPPICPTALQCTQADGAERTYKLPNQP